MHITIAICTHNRAELLRDTLASLFAMDLTEGLHFDVLVVDNCSADESAQVTEEFSRKYPGLVNYHLESKLGLVYARNAAIQQAKGDIIAFVDDDIFFDPGWLQATAGMMTRYPGASCMAGRIVPLFESGRPHWLGDDPAWLNIEGLYGATKFGDAERMLVYPEHALGGNMVFRKEAFGKAGLFDPALGRYGKSLLSKEESEFFVRMERAGLRTVYSPEAWVTHRIPPERANKEWVVRRFYWQGISQVLFEGLTANPSKRCLLSGIKNDLTGLWKILFGASLSPKAMYWQIKQWQFWHKVFVAYTWGVLKQRVKQLLYAAPKKIQPEGSR